MHRRLRSVRKTVLGPKGPVNTKELVQPDVLFWDDWPVRQPCLLFGALAAGREDWLATWKRLEPDPQVEEIRRNFPIRQPVLWLR